MNALLEGIGKVIGKITQFIPGRIEGLKNEKVRLLQERSDIQSKDFSASASNRIVAIDKRLREIESIISNKASD